jgi:hypothetical protein
MGLSSSCRQLLNFFDWNITNTSLQSLPVGSVKLTKLRCITNKVFIERDARPQVRTKIIPALPVNVATKDVNGQLHCCELRPVD